MRRCLFASHLLSFTYKFCSSFLSIKVGFGEFATSIMSRDQHLNDFSFQAIASVNFSRESSLQAALKDLKESGALTVLLMMQQENAYKLLKMVCVA